MFATLRNRTRRGFTLTEILVAIGMMSILGSFLTVMLYDAMNMWRMGERRRQVMERSNVAFDLIREDTAALVPPPSDRNEQFAYEYYSDPAGQDASNNQYRPRTINSGPIRLVDPANQNISVLTNGNEVWHRRPNEEEPGWMEFKFSVSPAEFRSGEVFAQADGPALLQVAVANSEGDPMYETVAGGDATAEFGEAVDITNVIETAIAREDGSDLSTMYIKLSMTAGEESEDDKMLRGRTGDGPVFSFRGRVDFGTNVLPVSGQFFAVPDEAGHRLMFYRTLSPANNVIGGEPGDIAEVVYIVRNGRLWRGVNAGFEDSPGQSLFLHDGEKFVNLYTDAQIEQHCVAVADGVLFFGLRFWGRHTQRWEPTLDEQGYRDQAEAPYAGVWGWQPERWEQGYNQPDWGLPRKMQVALIIRPVTAGGYSTQLIEPLPADTGGTIRIGSTQGLSESTGDGLYGRLAAHARIGDEWVRYSRVVGSQRIEIPAGGRGQWAFSDEESATPAHPSGEDMDFGELRVLTVRLHGSVPRDPLANAVE